jgi:hypothetical protein
VSGTAGTLSILVTSRGRLGSKPLVFKAEPVGLEVADQVVTSRMDNEPISHEAAYGVWADHSTLKRESLGPLFLRATVELRGPVDGRWRASYALVRKDTDQFARFTLDANAPSITFTFRSGDLAADLHGLVQRLELLVELANLHATAGVALDRRRQTSA